MRKLTDKLRDNPTPSEQIHGLNPVAMAVWHKAACEAADEIERLQDKLDRINQWCRAYPRTVFIEPTKEQWKRANEVLDDHDDCPSLTAISGSNMRHVVEGIQKIAKLDKAQ